MRQRARPDLWEARVSKPPGPTRQVVAHGLSPSQVIAVFYGPRGLLTDLTALARGFPWSMSAR